MKLTTTFAQQQFLELLRAGLWGTPADPALFTKEATDWKQIYRIAKEQTVQVIVADGIETLPKENWPPKEIMLKLMMVRVKTAQMHNLINSTLCKIVNALNAENLPSVLLKGQGVAQNYRHPESRMCGDIDLYVGIENFEKVCDTIASLSATPQEEDCCGHEMHVHLELDGVTIEAHRKASGSANKRQDELFDNWTKESLDQHFADNTLPATDFGQTPVQTPSADYNAVFILHHAVRHMITEGIGLRQVCDWTMFLYKHHAEINEDALRSTLRQFHMEDIWKEFGILATTLLGLNPNKLPLAPAKTSSNKTAKLLEQIFIAGNFGQYDPKCRAPKAQNYIKRKWYGMLVQTRRFCNTARIFPNFTLSYSIGWYIAAFARLIRRQ